MWEHFNLSGFCDHTPVEKNWNFEGREGRKGRGKQNEKRHIDVEETMQQQPEKEGEPAAWFLVL